MNKYNVKTMLLGGLLLSILATTPALADGHGSGGHGGHEGYSRGHGGHEGYSRGYGGWALGLGFATGALIGSELTNPYPYYYPYPYAYSYPYATSVVPSESYIVQPQVQVAPIAQPAPTNVWYYCESAKGYYPYTPSCAEGWKTVPAIPPSR